MNCQVAVYHHSAWWMCLAEEIVLCLNMCVLSHFSPVRLRATLWTVALQAPLSMGFSRKEYWSGLPGPFPGDLPDPGIKPCSLTSPTLAGRFFTTRSTWEAPLCLTIWYQSKCCWGALCYIGHVNISFLTSKMSQFLKHIRLLGFWRRGY